MRDAFVQTLMAIAAQDNRVMLLTGDLGFGVLDRFAQEFPRQFLNVGVAEQNLTGLAAGLALEGKIVFTYSIGNFNTLRCLEQIRNDVCYHQANVKIVSIGGGLCYGPLGVSHHATEDLAVMRALPNLKVVAPGDVVETVLATRSVYQTPGPCYLRLGRGNEPRVHQEMPNFELGKNICLASGDQVALLATGGILANAAAARNLLKNRGVAASLYSVHTLKPLDHACIKELAASNRLIATIEEHSVLGGLGGAVAEVLSEISGARACLVRLGLPEGFVSEVGDQEYLRRLYGLSAAAIAQQVLTALVREKLEAEPYHVLQSAVR
jgi:transketolase